MSQENATDPGRLHRRRLLRGVTAIGALGAGGEYLALVRPDGTTVAHEFAPAFPPQYRHVQSAATAVGGSGPAA